MLVVETIARIRREHFIKGKTIKEIARDLKVSRNTVRKVLRSGETSFEYERQVVYPFLDRKGAKRFVFDETADLSPVNWGPARDGRGTAVSDGAGVMSGSEV